MDVLRKDIETKASPSRRRRNRTPPNRTQGSKAPNATARGARAQEEQGCNRTARGLHDTTSEPESLNTARERLQCAKVRLGFPVSPTP